MAENETTPPEEWFEEGHGFSTKKAPAVVQDTSEEFILDCNVETKEDQEKESRESNVAVELIEAFKQILNTVESQKAQGEVVEHVVSNDLRASSEKLHDAMLQGTQDTERTTAWLAPGPLHDILAPSQPVSEELYQLTEIESEIESIGAEIGELQAVNRHMVNQSRHRITELKELTARI